MSIEAAAKRLTEMLNDKVPPQRRSMVIRNSHDKDGNVVQRIHVAFRAGFSAAVPPEIDGYEVRVDPWED